MQHSQYRQSTSDCTTVEEVQCTCSYSLITIWTHAVHLNVCTCIPLLTDACKNTCTYVPLLTGNITLSNVTFTANTDLNGASPQFTLTCISTGGPATTVTWTRDSEMLTGSTVLNDTETAQYTHTLTVTGRLEGLYTCTVSNDKPSEDSAQLFVLGTAHSEQFL